MNEAGQGGGTAAVLQDRDGATAEELEAGGGGGASGTDFPGGCEKIRA